MMKVASQGRLTQSWSGSRLEYSKVPWPEVPEEERLNKVRGKQFGYDVQNQN